MYNTFRGGPLERTGDNSQKKIPAKENCKKKKKILQAVHPSKKTPASKLNQSMISKHKVK